MNPTHISCKTAKALKEFLGENPPEPMEKVYWRKFPNQGVDLGKDLRHIGAVCYPAYRLEDLLSRPFCEAFFKVYGPHEFKNGWAYEDDYDVAVVLMERYYRGGLPAVEAELMRMMNKEAV